MYRQIPLEQTVPISYVDKYYFNTKPHILQSLVPTTR